MTFKLKTYEGQAKLSICLAVLGGLALLGVLFLMHRNFDRTTFYTTYNRNSTWLPLFLVGVLVALAAGTIGILVGLNSAGRRRNTRSALSWKGFFFNALVVTVTLCVFILFFLTRNPFTPRGA